MWGFLSGLPRLLYLHLQIPYTEVVAHASTSERCRSLDGSSRTSCRAGAAIAAWSALLQAHATLMRQLETDLEQETGLALADFDVLAQLAGAGGELRMTELAIARSSRARA